MRACSWAWLVVALVAATGCMEARLTAAQLAEQAADAKAPDAADGLSEPDGDAVPDDAALDAEAADADAGSDSSLDIGDVETAMDGDGEADLEDAEVADGNEVDVAPDDGLDAGDSTDTGACVPADCDDGNPCTVDLCNMGNCLHDKAAGNGEACTLTDKCQAAGSGVCSGGACKGGKPVDCSAKTDACNTGACDEETGACIAVKVADGTGCDADGDACTTNDACSAGQCKPGPNTCACSVANQAVDCDDGNACTVDTCVGAGAGTKCQHTIQAGAGCSDGNACTAGDSCTAAGSCQAGQLKACGANASCDAQDGQCKCGPGYAGDGQVCKCGAQMLAMDVDGKTVCAPDYPAWGIRPTSPPADWFKTNGDGTVTDLQSGLKWQQQSMTIHEGFAAAAATCQDLALAGHTDWRLPTRFELQTLLDFGRAGPALPPAFAVVKVSRYHWSASPYVPSASNMWHVAFEKGHLGNSALSANEKEYRCVRASAATPSADGRYTIDAAGGTVSDAVTKLEWPRDGQASGSISWNAAKTYCQGLQQSGGGWRMPSIVELHSLTDLSSSALAMDVKAFPGDAAVPYWSSTPAFAYPGHVWVVVFTDGRSVNGATTELLRARCVRGGACAADAGCDDGNPCTADTCTKGTCVNDPAPQQNKACDADGDACTVGDACQAGVCKAGAAKVCGNGSGCVAGGCVENTASMVAAGGYHSCLVTPAGAAKCWGRNLAGQLGDNSNENRLVPTQVVGLAASVKSVAAGAHHTCAVLASGAVVCWGQNSNGQLGDGTTVDRTTPVVVAGLAGATAVAAGGPHTCAILGTGAVKCWGKNADGEIGDGTTKDRLAPVQVTGLLAGAANISTGFRHNCVRFLTGSIACWGSNWFGQIGDGTDDAVRPTAVEVLGMLPGTKAIAAGGTHTCAVTAAGANSCWGENNDAELGNGSAIWSNKPTSGVGTNLLTISAGSSFNCATNTSGAALCWGVNNYGTVGNGSTEKKDWPTAVSGLSTGVSEVSAGGSHACALLKTGKVMCWGANQMGQLGDDTTTNRLTPVHVKGFGG